VELAVQRAKGNWSVLARDVMPEYSIVSGKRRISRQQLQPTILKRRKMVVT
jgi:hypothetical protein